MNLFVLLRKSSKFSSERDAFSKLNICTILFMEQTTAGSDCPLNAMIGNNLWSSASNIYGDSGFNVKYHVKSGNFSEVMDPSWDAKT